MYLQFTSVTHEATDSGSSVWRDLAWETNGGLFTNQDEVALSKAQSILLLGVSGIFPPKDVCRSWVVSLLHLLFHILFCM